MSKMIQVLVEVVIFTSIIGVIANQVFNAPDNLTGAALIIYSLITLFVVIGFIVMLLKQLGINTGYGR